MASQARSGHDPAVIAGEDGGDEDESDEAQRAAGLCGICVKAETPLDQPDGEPDHFADKERLGHGGGLEIEEVGIEGEEGKCESRRGGGSQWRARR